MNSVRESGERLREEILTAKAAAAISFSVQREETAYVTSDFWFGPSLENEK